MATKARHLKTPLQLWVADNRKRLGLTPTDLAQATGVTVDTARGWESRGRPSEDAISVLERRFGTRAPRDEQAAGTDLSELAAAIHALAQSIQEERSERLEWERSVAAGLRELGQALKPLIDLARAPRADGQGVGR